MTKFESKKAEIMHEEFVLISNGELRIETTRRDIIVTEKMMRAYLRFARLVYGNRAIANLGPADNPRTH